MRVRDAHYRSSRWQFCTPQIGSFGGGAQRRKQGERKQQRILLLLLLLFEQLQ